MTALLSLAACVALAALLHRTRRGRAQRTGVPRRSRALLGVVAILGLQLVVGAPAAHADECAAPNPERPGSGLVGAIDPPQGQGLAKSPYLKYGYAGMVWNVYPPECVNGGSGSLNPMDLPEPGTSIDTWLGNEMFNIAKTVVGATNSLHYTVMEGGLLSPLYEAVSTGAEKVYNNIYAQLFGVAALLLAIVMFRNIWRGDLATVGKRGLYALAAVWLAASSLAMLKYYDEIDNAIVQTTTNIQAGFVDSAENTVVRHVLPTQLHNHVVYENWLRGEFGSPAAPQAEQYGRPLLDAQAFTWSQIRSGADADQSVVNSKKDSYKDIAKKLGPATGYFTGEDGSRTGAGLLALGQSAVYSLFQLFAKAAVLLAQVLVRLFTLTAPLLGLIAIVHHDILRKVARVMGGVAFNLLVLSVLAGVHALLLQAIFAAGSSLSLLTKMVMAGLITVLLFLVGKPTRRLWQMVETSVGAVNSAVPTPRHGIFSRFRKHGNQPTAQDEFWRTMRDSDEAEGAGAGGPAGAAGAGGRARPEATVFASAQRLDRGARPGSHPASAWPDEQAAAATSPVEGGSHPALPPAGSAAAAAAFPVPGRADGDAQDDEHRAHDRHGERVRAGGARASRRVDTSPVTDRRWDHGDEPEPVVVPSRVDSGANGEGHHAHQDAHHVRRRGHGVPHAAQQAPRHSGAGPHRAESEMVAGKPVYVLYRPSQGLEVRQEARDTDGAVR